MAEEVVAQVEDQSPAQAAEPQPAVATAPDEDVATWKKRLAGKDQALTAAQKELASIREEAEKLRKFKAEVEFANMSELEKATAKAQQLEAELQATREAAERENLARKHPLYAQFAQETQGLNAAAQAEAFERFIGNLAKDKTVDSYVDTNSPRKPAPPAATKKTIEQIDAELKALGNPFQR